jgi:hypothetical protein
VPSGPADVSALGAVKNKCSNHQQKMKTKNMTTLHLRKSIGRSPLRLAFLLIPLLFGCFALSPTARAVTPAPDGGYPNNNTAEGTDSLFSLTSGSGNTAIGFDALYFNTTASSNTALGYTALYENTTGTANTAIGLQALARNTTGSSNTAVGLGALLGTGAPGHDNTAIGASAGVNVSGNNNIAIGSSAGQQLQSGESDSIEIGNTGVGGDSGTIRIGTIGTQTRTFIAGISETPITAGIKVGIGPDGQLGVRASAARFKEGIKPMDKASEVILALKPVTFHYRKALDPKGLPQFGLVAEEVAKVDPALVVSDAKGNPFTVRYDEVNAMLLNEFLKEHRTVQEQGATIAEFKKEIANLTATVKEQAAQIQKVSAHVELSEPAPRTVLNNQ